MCRVASCPSSKDTEGRLFRCSGCWTRPGSHGMPVRTVDDDGLGITVTVTAGELRVLRLPMRRAEQLLERRPSASPV